MSKVLVISMCLVLFNYLESASLPTNSTTSAAQCSANEEIHSCAAAICRAQICEHLGIPVACPGVSRCDAACVCKDGTLRNKEGTCVPERECPGVTDCPENEEFSMCIESHRFVTCEQKKNNEPWGDRTADDPCTKGCVCVRESLRDGSGKCVPEEQC